MDWLTFISTNIKSLAWPAVAIIALFVLKLQLAKLLGVLGNRLQTAKGMGFELTFGQGVDQVEEILPAMDVRESALLTTDDAERTKSIRRIENISELSRLPPPYIVSQAWLKLEQAIYDTMVTSAYIIPRARKPTLSALDYIDFATRQELLTKDEVSAVQQLRLLRNQAAHSINPDITITDALRYYDIASRLALKIKQRSEAKESGPT